MNLFLVLSTAGSEKEGHRIGKILVEKRLAACVNIIPGVTSHFYWEGRLCKEKEVILLIKTIKRNLRGIENHIREMNTYSVPEVLFIEIDEGYKKYLDWVQGMAGQRREKGLKKIIDKRYPKR